MDHGALVPDELTGDLVMDRIQQDDGKDVYKRQKPGVVIGKVGAEIEKIKAEVQKLTDKKLVVDIKEVKRPDKDAQLVAENIALQLENCLLYTSCIHTLLSYYWFEDYIIVVVTKAAVATIEEVYA